MKLIALKPLRYAGKSLLSGDEFEASAKDAKLLKAIRKAADAPVKEPEPEPDKKPVARTRKTVASDTAAVDGKTNKGE